MNTIERMMLIEARLQEAFSPSYLEVIDDSDKHVGHVGSRDGAGHYTVVIAGEAFPAKERIAAHRKIYTVLADLIPQEVHALQIKIKLS